MNNKKNLLLLLSSLFLVTFIASCGEVATNPTLPGVENSDTTNQENSEAPDAGDDEWIWWDDVETDNDEEEVPPEEQYPEDTGTKKSNIFEAELALFDGSSRDMDHACPAASYHYHHTFSNGLVIKNMYHNLFKYKFTSDKKVKANMLMRVASNKDWTETLLESNYSIEMNGKSVNISDIKIPGSTEAESIEGSIYFNMVDVIVPININEGDNEIEFISSAAPVNFDYFDIQTSATINNKTEGTYFQPIDKVITISKLPTKTTKGEITITCNEPTCTKKSAKYSFLPVLGDSSYEVVAEGDTVTYYATIAGVKHNVGSITKIDADKEYTLTIIDGKLDNNQNTGKFKLGEKVSLTLTGQVPQGKKLIGWYDIDERAKAFSNDPKSIIMPSKNITIAPLFEGEKVDFKRDTPSGLGKLNLNNASDEKTGGYTFGYQAKSTNSPELGDIIVNGEMGRSYYSASVTAGQFSIPMTAYCIEANVDHTFEYTFENFSDKVLRFKLFMVNSSNDACVAPANAIEVSLNPNEVKKVTWIANYTSLNNNVLPIYHYLDDMTNMRFGATLYCVKKGA